jgi:hypothetical protein
MEYDLDVITLPYDSLNIEDIVVSNFTILARSGNTIYKSTDDGTTWKIAFDSELKVNQLYSKDPHTILLVGEKGMVYRTMDYGETWLDERVEDKYDINMIAAKDYTNYFAVSGHQWFFYKESLNSDWQTLYYESPVYLSTLAYGNGRYYFGGGSTSRNYEYRNEQYYEFSLKIYTFYGTGFGRLEIGHEWGGTNHVQIREADSLRLFNSDDSLYYSVTDFGDCYVTYEDDFQFGYEKYYDLYKLKSDVAVGLLDYSDTLYIFSRKGKLEIIQKKNIPENGLIKDIFDLNIDLVNQLNNPYRRVIYIASNNSRIYKMSIYEPISSIQVETNNLIKQYNEVLWIDDEVELLGIYNYIGQKELLNYQSENRIILKKGIYFISYLFKNNFLTSKILVN